jgi:hypothetical protein
MGTTKREKKRRARAGQRDLVIAAVGVAIVSTIVIALVGIVIIVVVVRDGDRHRHDLLLPTNKI